MLAAGELGTHGLRRTLVCIPHAHAAGVYPPCACRWGRGPMRMPLGGGPMRMPLGSPMRMPVGTPMPCPDVLVQSLGHMGCTARLC
eukprot:357075-Chlamydomonas_euryale.AAC.3